MPIGYRIGVAVTSLLLLAASPTPPPPSCRTSSGTSASADGLYSRRALHRARRIFELRLLELRKARLERVRAAILQRLPADTLLEGDSGVILKQTGDSRVICHR